MMKMSLVQVQPSAQEFFARGGRGMAYQKKNPSAEERKAHMDNMNKKAAGIARGRVAPGQCETVRHGSHGNDNGR